MRTNEAGLTLIEVLVAVMILTVGVLAVAGLQASGLRATRMAQIVQQMNNDARSEIGVWRGAPLDTLTPTSRSCATALEGCSVEIRPCIVSAGNLYCDLPSVAEAQAHAVTVTVESQERSVTLSTVVLH